MKNKTSSFIIQKIFWYKQHYSGISETARALGISRSVAGYWFGGWKRKPKKNYIPENIEGERRIVLAEKALINSRIIKGLWNEEPVKMARNLRNKFFARYDLWSEEII